MSKITTEERELLNHAIEYFGAEAQVIKAAEEYAEAAAEIARAAFAMAGNGKYDFAQLAEELADAEIMQAQLCEIFHAALLCPLIVKKRKEKLARLAALTDFAPTL